MQATGEERMNEWKKKTFSYFYILPSTYLNEWQMKYLWKEIRNGKRMWKHRDKIKWIRMYIRFVIPVSTQSLGFFIRIWWLMGMGKENFRDISDSCRYHLHRESKISHINNIHSVAFLPFFLVSKLWDGWPWL